MKSPRQCGTCKFYEDDEGKAACNIREEWISDDTWKWIEVVGCASWDDGQSQCVQESTFPSSSDLLLIAHDEWKRREERKHIHEEITWTHGWISGFLTSRKFVKERIAELRLNGDEL